MEARNLNETPYSVASYAPASDWQAGVQRALTATLATLATLRLWVRRSAQRSELRALIDNDDRFFRDIGLSRADAYYESDKWFWKA